MLPRSPLSFQPSQPNNDLSSLPSSASRPLLNGCKFQPLTSPSDSSNISSVSRILPSHSHFSPPFPSPLVTVTDSEIDTISVKSSESSVASVDSQCDAIMATRALLCLSCKAHLREMRMRQREARLHRMRMHRVALWLSSSTVEDHNASTSTGNHFNPIVLSSGSDVSSNP